MKEKLEMYAHTMWSVCNSMSPVIGIIMWMVMFFSLLIYVFERGEYDSVNKIWVRDEDGDESPFSYLGNCIYFTIVTMTTIGYGDIYPKTFGGKLVVLLSSFMGIINLLIIMNIIGVSFKENYRNNVLEKIKREECELAEYIEEVISQSSEKFNARQPEHVRLINPRSCACGCINNVRLPGAAGNRDQSKTKFKGYSRK